LASLRICCGQAAWSLQCFTEKPAGFQRYRVADTNTLQVLSAKTIFPAQKVYQNREIQDLFGRFRTMKSFEGATSFGKLFLSSNSLFYFL